MQDRGAVSLYLALVVALGAAFYALIIGSGRLGAAGGLYVQGMMWTPAIAAALTVWLRKLSWASLGLAWGGGRAALLAYLTPLAYATTAYAFVWLVGIGGFPNTQAIAAISEKLGWHLESPAAFIAAYVVMVGTLGMILATATALGEEIGWRGFLTPRLVSRFGFVPGSLMVGLIWGAWHLPLVLGADYNAATPAWFAVTCFMVMVCALCVIVTYFRMRSGSVWPCAILHASHNLYIQQVFTPLTTPRGSITAYFIDEFGVAIAVVAVGFAALVWWRAQREAA
jgi:membrane protease YdiL (CAAX protease family)